MARHLGRPVIIGDTYTSNGYRVVTMKRPDGTRKVERVHRLVASAFCERKEGQYLVRHLNDIRTDNRVDNLSWGTTRDNKQDADRNGKVVRGESHHGAFITDEQVREIYLSSESTVSIAKRLGVANSYATHIRYRRARATATCGLGRAPGAIGLGGARRGVGEVINAEIAREIYTSPRPASEMARKYGVSQPYIHRIRGGVKWKSATAGLVRPTYMKSIAGVRVNADGSLTGRSITGEQAIEIFMSPERGRDIAQRMGISEALVSTIRKRGQWGQLTQGLTPPNRPNYRKHRSQDPAPLGV